jgi:heterodisulfide reductase subunit B2
MKSLGADPLDWSYKTRCCGGALGISQLPIALDLARKILRNAKQVGAPAVVVACPLCQVNLDARQQQISREGQEEYNLPILYFTQLMGLAFGMDAATMELDRHFTDPSAIVRAYQETRADSQHV